MKPVSPGEPSVPLLRSETLVSPTSAPLPEGTVPKEELATARAPSFAAPLECVGDRRFPLAGEVIDDFELLRELGRGAFATVYLARQLSLNRRVALKVGPNRGHEGQSLASLEHEHIVQVFSESVVPDRNLRLLCMQYVPGATLQDVMEELPAVRRLGRDFLAALDRVAKQPEEFRPSALQEREELGRGTFAEAVCQLGRKLAEGLAFAHRQGVLHRDIKPANILLNAYGRPYLADFNLATLAEADPASNFGGTLAYMAPEHLAAFGGSSRDAIRAVDQRADLYALGLVLFELLAGKLPFPFAIGYRNRAEMLAQAQAARKEPISWPEAIPLGLRAVLARCLAFDPSDRQASADELAAELETCRRQLARLQRLPAIPRVARFAERHPFATLLLLAFGTNVLGSLVNIAYNAVHIVGHFTPAQQSAFQMMVIGYNGLAYPLLVGLTAWLILILHRGWRKIVQRELLPAAELARYRRLARFCITWSMLGTLLGWLPGGLLFPLVIHAAEPLSASAFNHFVVSFTLSGLIAVTFCYLGSTWVVLRLLYPVLWAQPVAGQSLAAELRRDPPRLGLFQCLAGLIPLSGAMLMLVSGTGDYGDFAFRLLICSLIMLGMLGFVVAVRVCQSISRVLKAFDAEEAH